MSKKTATPFVSSDEEDEIESKPQRKSSGDSDSNGYVPSSYRDYYHEDAKSIKQMVECPKGKRRGPRGGVVVPFPVKLYNMLEGVEQEGLEYIVSWQPHGRCFIVRRSKEFVEDVMPRYFRQSKLTSFQRQLNLYGFVRITSGRDRGGYYHELFLKGRPDLCKVMLRTRVKGGAPKGGSPPEMDPNFYAMPLCMDKKKKTKKSSPVTKDPATKPTTKTEEPEPDSDFHQALSIPPDPVTSLGPITVTESNEIPELHPLGAPTEVLSDVSLEILQDTILPLPPIHPELTTSKPLPCPYPLVSVDFPEDASHCISGGDETGYFAGLRFRCMDEASLDAFESTLIHNIR